MSSALAVVEHPASIWQIKSRIARRLAFPAAAGTPSPKNVACRNAAQSGEVGQRAWLRSRVGIVRAVKTTGLKLLEYYPQSGNLVEEGVASSTFISRRHSRL